MCVFKSKSGTTTIMASNAAFMLAVLLSGAASVAVLGQYQATPDVVRGLDVTRYTGLWFGIAKFPTSFDPANAYNATAFYSLNPDGSINVFNNGFIGVTRNSARGLAVKADPGSDEAKFILSFQTPPSNNLVYAGDYWVLNVDKQNYFWSLVGGSTRDDLFILARARTIPESLYDYIVGYARSQGFDVSRLVRTPQIPA